MTATMGGSLLAGLEESLEDRLHNAIERLGIERTRAMAATVPSVVALKPQTS